MIALGNNTADRIVTGTVTVKFEQSWSGDGMGGYKLRTDAFTTVDAGAGPQEKPVVSGMACISAALRSPQMEHEMEHEERMRAMRHVVGMLAVYPILIPEEAEQG